MTRGLDPDACIAQTIRMQYRTLGTTGIRVSTISFGAGPVSQLLVGADHARQRDTIARAIDCGINWFDTAAGYGDGQSEENLGRTLSELGSPPRVHVATKVRLMPNQLSTPAAHVRDSVLASLRRLRVDRITLLQIHNSITTAAGTQPTSISPAHVLSSGGVLEEMERLQQQGLVEHLGLTGLGEPEALRKVIDSGAFAAIQIPYNLLNTSAGQRAPPRFAETDYGDLISYCGLRSLGVFAIRVFAGGAIVGQPPSPHTHKTPFFPLQLYQQDCQKAAQLNELLPLGLTAQEAAVRFVLCHRSLTSAIIGLATPAEVVDAVRFAEAGPLDRELLARLNGWSMSASIEQ